MTDHHQNSDWSCCVLKRASGLPCFTHKGHYMLLCLHGTTDKLFGPMAQPVHFLCMNKQQEGRCALYSV